MTQPTLILRGVAKSFTLHQQQGTKIPVFERLDLEVAGSECVVLRGASGSGKSTVLRLVHGNYKALAGEILLNHDGQWLDLLTATPRQIMEVRRLTMGYVSQFLRVIPRVPALEIVAEPLRRRGVPAGTARDRAAALLARLNVPEPLWSLSPMTFSGGEQQRVNVAHGFIADYPLLLLDEPTASLDADNRRVVVELILEARARGCAMLGIFHDQEVRDAVGTRDFDVAEARAAA